MAVRRHLRRSVVHASSSPQTLFWFLSIGGWKAAVEKPKFQVLVPEHEPLVRRMASEIICNAGWTAIEASNSGEALHLLAGHSHVMILFVDAEMPGSMNGIQLSERVQARHEVELVITSAKNLILSQLPDEATFLRKRYGLSDLIRVLCDKLWPSAKRN